MCLDIPNKIELVNTINHINNVDLEKVSYERIYSAILNEIRYVPVEKRNISTGTLICRGRVNKGNFFCSEKEITYNCDVFNIKKFGRMNTPYQTLFYGSIATEAIINPEVIALFEISNFLPDINSTGAEIITVGIWRVKDDIKIIDTSFRLEDIEKLKEKYSKKTEEIDLIVNLFSKNLKRKKSDVPNHNYYKISAAYSNFIFEKFPDYAGITYPSIKTDMKGYNIVMLPEVADNNLELIYVKVFQIIKVKADSIYDEFMFAKNLGIYNTDFKWEFTNQYSKLVESTYTSIKGEGLADLNKSE